jgi:MFS family permease
MAADGVAALIAGTTFDRVRKRGGTGASVVVVFVIAGAAYAPLVWLGSQASAIAGIALWSIALAATASVGRAMIATMVPRGERGRAYGLYYLVWGVAWWLGSILLGVLYDQSRAVASAVAVGALVIGAAVVAASARVMQNHKG